MEILDEKVNAHLPHYSTLKKFWNGFFQTFQAGLLCFSGGSISGWLFGNLFNPPPANFRVQKKNVCDVTKCS